MESYGLLIVLFLVGLLVLGIVGMVRGNRVRSCCESEQTQPKDHTPQA